MPLFLFPMLLFTMICSSNMLLILLLPGVIFVLFSSFLSLSFIISRSFFSLVFCLFVCLWFVAGVMLLALFMMHILSLSIFWIMPAAMGLKISLHFVRIILLVTSPRFFSLIVIIFISFLFTLLFFVYFCFYYYFYFYFYLLFITYV
jgi:hypothetical protein